MFKRCPNCGVILRNLDLGDTAIWFAMFLSGIFLAMGVLILEISFQPRLFIHVFIWVPVSILLSLIFLRIFKYLFVYLLYRKVRLGKNIE